MVTMAGEWLHNLRERESTAMLAELNTLVSILRRHVVQADHPRSRDEWLRRLREFAELRRSIEP